VMLQERYVNQGISMNASLRRIKFSRWLSVPLSLLGLLTGAYAQEQSQAQKKSTPPPDIPVAPQQVVSELSKDNLDRVAASPGQLKAVLVQDAGLLVELKRWIAKEASDYGQIVSDEDLTDAAVFQRLTEDVKFRAVATRLVQKYGYLRPTINPDSEMGRQQVLVLQERAKKIVQIQAEEDAEEAAIKRQQRESIRLVPCPFDADDSQGDETLDCYDYYGTSRIKGGTNAPDNKSPIPRTDPQQYPSPQQNYPPYPNSPILRAQGGGGVGPDQMLSGSGQDSSISQRLSDLMISGGMAGDASLLTGGSMGADQLDLTSLDPRRLQALQALQNSGGSSQDLSASNNDRSDMSGRVDPYQPRRPRNREVVRPETVHEPNPYNDIPSLYDLYVQAPSRNGSPQRFGAQVFRDGMKNSRAVPMDLPVGPDYVVGPGDSLSIDMWGGVSNRLVRIVDREGRVALPEAGPVEVSGKTLDEVQQLVQRALSSQYRDTSAEVSVARLRTVRIYVVGEVGEPGAYDISSLSTPLNALVASGGVSQKGSLRLLKHYRGRQLLETVDTYDLLLRGVTPDAKKLDNGDTLLVPPVGAQITVTGMVRRPAIYELRDEKTLADVLDLAGGILPAATLKHVEVQRLEAHEKRTMLSLDLSPENGKQPELTAFGVKDGDEIHIFPIAPYNQDMIYLQGHVLRPGKYSFTEGMKVTDIVTSYNDLLPEPAAHYGEIIRLHSPDFHPTVVSFDLAAAMRDPASAPALQPLDTVRIFSRFDFEPAPVVSVSGEVRSPGTYKTSGQSSLRDAVFIAGGLTPNASLENAQVFRINADGSSKIFSVNLREALNGNAADNILLQPRDRLLIHRSSFRVDASTVEITGEVAKPGRYPYSSNMHAEDLIQAAGGLKRSADTNLADLTRYSASGGISEHLEISLVSMANGNATEDVQLKSGDVLAIRQVPGWKDIGASVKVGGEVMHPSTYGLQPGERLSSVLARAGGYTKSAYPYGALLMRRDVREMERKNQTDLVARIKVEKVQLKALPENDADQRNAKLTAIAETDTTLEELSTHEPVGRVVIHIQKDVNSWKGTDADVTLHAGDELYIPKNPNTILVTGQIFNPTAINLQPGRSAKWYLSQAGGLTPMADKKAVFVIRADGSVISAKNNSNGWWGGDPLSASLRAGDTIVVPEKAPKIGGPTWTTVMQAAQLVTSIALVIAYIHP
jgi:protein involved in polysaccharide export with SLBB domain